MLIACTKTPPQRMGIIFLSLALILLVSLGLYWLADIKGKYSDLEDFTIYILESYIGITTIFLFLSGSLLVSGLPEKIWLWVKTGNWQKISEERTYKNPPTSQHGSLLRKSCLGAAIVILWLGCMLAIDYSMISLGAIPYAALTFFWLWIFAKVTGVNLGFKKRSL